MKLQLFTNSINSKSLSQLLVTTQTIQLCTIQLSAYKRLIEIAIKFKVKNSLTNSISTNSLSQLMVTTQTIQLRTIHIIINCLNKEFRNCENINGSKYSNSKYSCYSNTVISNCNLKSTHCLHGMRKYNFTVQYVPEQFTSQYENFNLKKNCSCQYFSILSLLNA